MGQLKVDGMDRYSFRDSSGRIVSLAYCTRKVATKWELQKGTSASLWKKGEKTFTGLSFAK